MSNILETDSRALPALPNKPDRTNWVERAGHLPSYIERVAKHLHWERRWELGRAIATAVNWCRAIALTGRTFGGRQQVSPAVRARAAAAWAEWKAKAARSRAQTAAKRVSEADLLEAERVALGPAIEGGVVMDRRVERNAMEAATAVLASLEEGASTSVGVAAAGAGASVGRPPARGHADARRRDRQRRAQRGARGSGESKRAQSWNETAHPRAGKGVAAGGQFIKAGSSGDEVKAIQKKVGAKGDGKYGAQTQRAVREFQKRHGLKVDGVVGRQTAAALAGDYAGARRTKTGGLSRAEVAALAKAPAKRRGTKPRTQPRRVGEADAIDDIVSAALDDLREGLGKKLLVAVKGYTTKDGKRVHAHTRGDGEGASRGKGASVAPATKGRPAERPTVPGRTASGSIADFRRMDDDKLKRAIADLARGAEDEDADDAASSEARRRGWSDAQIAELFRPPAPAGPRSAPYAVVIDGVRVGFNTAAEAQQAAADEQRRLRRARKPRGS